MRTKLEDFLREEGLFEDFVCNVFNANKAENDLDAIEGAKLLVDVLTNADISGAFTWTASPEGWDFWKEVEKRFTEWCKIN